MIAANTNTKEDMMKLNRDKTKAAASRKKGSQQTAKGTVKYKEPRDVLKGHNVKVHVHKVCILIDFYHGMAKGCCSQFCHIMLGINYVSLKCSLIPQDIISTLQSVGRIQKKRQTTLITADDDETTLALSMVQIGRLVSNNSFNLEVGMSSGVSTWYS